MIKFRHLPIICFAFTMSACAGHHMALTKGQSGIDLTKKSIALLSIKVSNQHKPNYQLDLTGVKICPQGETCSRPLPYFHKAGAPYKSEKDRFNEFLLSFGLESGTYNLQWIGSTYQGPLVTGFGGIPVYAKIDVKPNTIIYLGHLEVVLRERKNDTEKRAGKVIPVLDQSVPGFSTGTFDVIVEDKFDEDMQAFIKEYPALQKVKVEKSILPQWIRPENNPLISN
ncbi:MAG TPA: hypothetical protein VK654_17005 [Nitrospirota bacterium]|nr:hypothetical protein [Nitrospirota bacterium]